jgi:prepilin-type N-terminal cleavage/methylation domain-containing protein
MLPVQQSTSQSRGFTLIELLVVIAIIIVLATTGFANMRPLSRHAKLMQDANEVVALMRTARQHSISVLVHPRIPGEYPSYGVSLSKNSSSVQEYADCVGDDDGAGQINYEDSFSMQSDSCGAAANTVIDTITLKNSKVSYIEYQTSTSGTTPLPSIAILYLRPEPTIWFSTAVGGGIDDTVRHPTSGTIIEPGTAIVTLASLDDREEVQVRFNAAGLVTVVE